MEIPINSLDHVYQKTMMDAKSVERAYIFAVATIIFGLPLGISFYPIQNDWRLGVEFTSAYLFVAMAVTIFLLLNGKGGSKPFSNIVKRNTKSSYLMVYLSLILGTASAVSFALMKYSLAKDYPYPSAAANFFGGIYIAFLTGAAALGIPFAVGRGIGVVRRALSEKVYYRAALLVGIAYFITYEILVNEIVITGFNTPPGNYVPSPNGHYPWVYVFTGGPSPSSFLESLVYVPYVLIQLNPVFNFFFVPFEMLFAITLSTLMGAGIAVVLYSIKRSSKIGAACRRGAALSGLGGFIGYTATCPSCLAPTLVSAILGGFSVAQSLYSNIYGILVPPAVSLIALTFNLLLLNRLIREDSPEWVSLADVNQNDLTSRV
ncbi:MAG: hypothetical protein QXX17_07230 [Conexivisphaerales archaeon]